MSSNEFEIKNNNSITVNDSTIKTFNSLSSADFGKDQLNDSLDAIKKVKMVF